jgi:predicted DNA-binding protein (UPF0251 family)
MSTNKEKNSDSWITQAEAARLRGVSRQAIHNLIKKGRIKTLKIASIVFVDKNAIQNYKSLNAGRPKRKNNG